jgi:hypothetical protein
VNFAAVAITVWCGYQSNRNPGLKGLREAYMEVIPTLLLQAQDEQYYVRQPVPEPVQKG